MTFPMLGSLARWRWGVTGFEGQQGIVCLASLGQQQGRCRVACWRSGIPAVEVCGEMGCRSRK